MPSKLNHLTRCIPLVCMALVLLSALFPDMVYAFTDAVNVLPASRKDKPLMENMVWIGILTGLMFISIIMFFGVGDLIAGMFASLGDARRTGEWGPFLRTLAIVISILLISFALAALMFGFATSGINLKPNITIG